MHEKLLIISLLFVFVFGLSFSVLAASEKPLTNQAAYNIFKNALGGSFRKLDAGYKSGFVGSWEYITKEIGTSTIMSTKGTNYDLFATSTIAKLDWFKKQFLDNTNDNGGRIAAGREKDGIKNAMVDRYKDLCAKDLQKAAPALFKTYRDGIKTAKTTRTASIKKCNTNHSNCVKSLSLAERIIKMEECLNIKDDCTNTAYDVYNTAVQTAYTATFSGVLANYSSCLSAVPPIGGGQRDVWTWAK